MAILLFAGCIRLTAGAVSRVVYETYLPIPTTAQTIVQPTAPVLVAVDGTGHPYIAGTRVPSPDVSQAFITKYDVDRKTEFFTAVLDNTVARAVTLDTSGNIYLVGTPKTGFRPTVGSFQQSPGGGFVAKFDARGSVVWSSWLSATPYAVAVDTTGAAYISGEALADFSATPGAFRSNPGPPGCLSPRSPSSTCADAFVVKVSADGSRVLYATLLGGFKTESVSGLAIDPTGSVYVAGTTSSPDFPVTPGAPQTRLDRGRAPSTDPSEYRSDAFLTRLNPTGSAVLFSTYIGGTEWENSGGIARGPDGSIYLTGTTGSPDFTVTPGAFQTYRNPGRPITPGFGNGFFLKLNPAGTLKYSSFYSTSDFESVGKTVLDGAGRLYFVHNISVHDECAASVTLVAVSSESGEMLGEQEFRGGYMNTVSIAASQGLLYAAARADVTGNPFAVTPDAAFRNGTALFVAVDFSKNNDFAPSCLTNGASFRVARRTGEAGISLAPGEIFSLFGRGLGKDVRIRLGDTQIPVLYADELQINATIPYTELPGVSALTVQRGDHSAAYPVQVFDVFPGIFSTTAPDDLPRAVLINEDGKLNTQTNPARIGSAIKFYATGLGALTDAGELATPFELSMAGAGSNELPAVLLSARPASGFPPGVVEVQARIPQNVSTLSSRISIRYGDPRSGASTSSQLWVAR